MKIISIILVIIFTGLTILPCTDTFAEERCATEVHLHQSDQNQDAADLDLCSPLCGCNCCQVHAINNNPFIYKHHVEFTNMSSILDHSIPIFSYSTWHPPKV